MLNKLMRKLCRKYFALLTAGKIILIDKKCMNHGEVVVQDRGTVDNGFYIVNTYKKPKKPKYPYNSHIYYIEIICFKDKLKWLLREI